MQPGDPGNTGINVLKWHLDLEISWIIIIDTMAVCTVYRYT